MTSVMTQNPAASPELAAVKTRQQAMWASGDFAVPSSHSDRSAA